MGIAQYSARRSRVRQRTAPLAVAGIAVILTTCGSQPEPAQPVPGGDVARGALAIQRYGCQACHAVPGVVGHNGQVGPPLGGIASRTTLAGRLPNTPETMVRWLMYPQTVQPGTVMPDMGVSEAEARDMAAYLYTLR